MNSRSVNLLAVAGVAGTIIGIAAAISSFLQSNFLGAVFSSILVIGGIVMLAIAFGD